MAGSAGESPNPGQASNRVGPTSDSLSATGRQNEARPPAPGKKTMGSMRVRHIFAEAQELCRDISLAGWIEWTKSECTQLGLLGAG